VVVAQEQELQRDDEELHTPTMPLQLLSMGRPS
jgi:hypothetical protein